MLSSIIVWTTVFYVFAFRVKFDPQKASVKLYGFHLFLAWLLLILHSSGVQMLLWAVFNSDSISTYFYIPIGLLPAWFNLSTWVIGTALSIVAMFISFGLVKGNDTVRVWLIRLIPLLYLFAIIEGARTLFRDSETSSQWESVIVGGMMFALPFAAMHYFYRRDDVKKAIFVSDG